MYDNIFTKTVLISNKYLHIYWNLFTPSHKAYGLHYHLSKYTRPLTIWFNWGKGVISLSIGQHK